MRLPIPEILSRLKLTISPAPTLPCLSSLLGAWAQHIPWESASRIARHQFPGTPEDHARLPPAFFHDWLHLGTGGTCFETNLALRALLDEIGYHTMLSFCDMEHSSTENPHCAVVVMLDGALYLADAGYPVPGALPLDPVRPTRTALPVYTFTVTPIAPRRWAIRRTSGEFESACFTLKAEPIDEDIFRARLIRDHAADGLFLNEIILNRAQGNHYLRYSESKGLIRRVFGREQGMMILPNDREVLPARLADIFGVNEMVLRAAICRRPLPELGAVWGQESVP